jgi:hypothetical protein
MNSLFKPYNQIHFDFKASLTIEESVLAMLGWKFHPYRDITVEQENTLYDMEINDIDPEEFFREPRLFEVLTEVKESADNVYNEVRIDDPGNQPRLNQALEDIQKAHQFINKAYQYYCAIADELSKGMGSGLRLDKYTSESEDDCKITIHSLRGWAKTIYDINLFDNKAPVLDGINQSQEEVQERILEPKKVDATQLQILFAKMIWRVADRSSKFRKGDKPNYSAIYNEVYESKNRTDSDEEGLSQRTTHNQIESALKTASNPETALVSTTIFKNLQISVSILAKYLVSKLESDGQKPSDSFCHLAQELAESKPGPLDSQTIIGLLEKAHQTRFNPHKPKE